MKMTKAGPMLEIEYLPEPRLQFGSYFEHEDSKTGLAEFGPFGKNVSGLHPSDIRIGFIGTRETIAGAREWIEDLRSPIESENRKTVGSTAKQIDSAETFFGAGILDDEPPQDESFVRVYKILNRSFFGMGMDHLLLPSFALVCVLLCLDQQLDGCSLDVISELVPVGQGRGILHFEAQASRSDCVQPSLNAWREQSSLFSLPGLDEPFSYRSNDFVNLVELQEDRLLFKFRTPFHQDSLLASLLGRLIGFFNDLLDDRFPFFSLHRMSCFVVHFCLLISAIFPTRKPISSPSSSATGATPWMFLMKSSEAPRNALKEGSPARRPSMWPSGVMTISTSRGVVQSSPSRQPRIAWKCVLTCTARSFRAQLSRIWSVHEWECRQTFLHSRLRIGPCLRSEGAYM